MDLLETNEFGEKEFLLTFDAAVEIVNYDELDRFWSWLIFELFLFSSELIDCPIYFINELS